MLRYRNRFFLRGEVVSDEGYSVRANGRAGFIYTDDVGTAIVGGDLLVSGPFDYVVYRNQIYDHTVTNLITDNERRELILSRVLAAAAFWKMKIEIEPPFAPPKGTAESSSPNADTQDAVACQGGINAVTQ